MNLTPPTDTFAAEAVLGHMKAAGVDYLFANGGTDFPSIIEALARSPETGIAMPEAMVIPHEGVAVGMAHGYYLMTGRPQAVMVHVNVGLANSVMGLINAASDNAPVLMCSGRTPLTEAGRFGSRNSPIHWGQEMRDQAGLVREAVKWDYELRYPDQAGQVVDRALNIALSEPRGPVYLSLPREALAEPYRAERQAPALAPSAYGAAPAPLIEEAATLLASARNPVILTQSKSLSDGFEPLAGFAERFALPVVEYWATRLALPASHPMNVGRDPLPWLQDADVVLVIDAMVPWISDHFSLPEGCKVIGLGPDPQYQRVPMRSFRLDLALAGGTDETIRALDAALRERIPAEERFEMRRSRAARFRQEREATARRQIEAGAGSPMTPAWVSHCLSEAAGEDAVFFNELGVDPTAMRFETPRSFFSTPLSGGLGWGMTAALGAQLAAPDRQVIATIGDGSYMFANPVACHQTAAAHGLPLLTVVFNNGIWNAVRRSALYMYPKGRAAAANTMPVTALRPTPDHCGIARAHGAWAESVDTGEALPAAIERALAATRSGQQALLEVMVSY